MVVSILTGPLRPVLSRLDHLALEAGEAFQSSPAR